MIVDEEECVELLTILLGRVLQIVEAEEKGKLAEDEVQYIVQCIHPAFTSASDERVREAALDIVRYLPARSAREIQFVLQVGKVRDMVQQAVWLAI